MQSPPYESQQHLPSFKHLFESIVVDNKPNHYGHLSPPHLYDETEDDSDSSPSRSLSPKQSYHDTSNRSPSDTFTRPLLPSLTNRRKSVPHKSPSMMTDQSVVFQLFHDSPAHYLYACDQPSTTKIICGQSLLSKLRKKVQHARDLIQLPPPSNNKRRLTPPHKRRNHSIIELPQLMVDRPRAFRPWIDDEEEEIEKLTCQPPQQSRKRPQQQQQHDGDLKRIKKSLDDTSSRTTVVATTAAAGRPSRVKGPCQACNEASDGCMRKAFNWPFTASQVFYDKGKPFVYLCNKCGLRYNKSGGCVCRHCRWVFCKEEKKKALQHIEVMRLKRPDGYVDPEEEIENFLCSPKYWTCGRKWKVGWVLNAGEEEEADTTHA